MSETHACFSQVDAGSSPSFVARSWTSVVSMFLQTAVFLGARQGWAEDEITIGRTAAGQLKVQLEFAQPLELAASIFSGISGYATGEVGIHSTLLDDPTNDFFQLSTAADSRFMLVAKDSGMEVWNDTGTGYLGVGETFFIGPAPFDTHPIWNIVNGVAGNAYSLTLKVLDVNGVYSESAPFELSFTPVLLRYRLNLTQLNSMHATLSWGTNAIGWELQSTVSLASPDWSTITNAPAIAGTNFSLNITTDGPQQFFRLHKQ